MSYFKDKVAIVTGGASGIGRALCQELGQRETTVVVADINHQRSQQTASALSAAEGTAQAALLDVSNAEDVQTLVEQTVSTYGHLDFMFNNAGITIGGEIRDMALEHWQCIFATNLWGVIYGTTSAYRVMVDQGFGHIVNTASIGGLTPVPMGTAYAATKHAVVGLSTSLRTEGAGLGVKVSVVCPGHIKTNTSERAIMVTKVKDEEALNRLMTAGGLVATAEYCARVILRGVRRNKAIITVTPLAGLVWWLYRLSPDLVIFLFQKMARALQALRADSA
jgi:NAD(P)-dependent dehydrogenase (short-subunit alcohol dehydrogenase family)